MKYMGSKARIAKHILPIILKGRTPNQFFVEPFCGGCNITDKVSGNIVANDANTYLISMWKALISGWIPPKEISREFYSECREQYNKRNFNINPWVIGYVGFNGSYGGRFYDGGYAGIVKSKKGIRNYPLEAYRNVRKQVDALTEQNIKFYDLSYDKLCLPEDSIIYCDPPYANTKKYNIDFNQNDFWNWCRKNAIEGHTVFVSEYNAPDDFECVWEKEVKSSLSANGKIGGSKNSIEKLWRIK